MNTMEVNKRGKSIRHGIAGELLVTKNSTQQVKHLPENQMLKIGGLNSVLNTFKG